MQSTDLPADRPVGPLPEREPPSTAALPHRRPDAAPVVRPIASATLFAGATEVHIEHRGALYRLKQTALGKLILTK